MKIAIIDDQHEIRYSLSKILQRNHHTTFQFNGEEEDFCVAIAEQGIELLVMDMMLGENLTGIDLIKKLKKADIALPIILMTAYTTPSNMIEASKIGIKDILQKPFDEASLISLVDKYRHVPKKEKQTKLALKQGREEFVGSFETMREIYRKIGIASNNDLSVLIFGETGTGKELIATLIHTNSDKNEQPFIAVNCASIPKDLFESQLFGHEKGSFTSADKQHIGFAEQTGSGTLFLDEIGELDNELQSKLLRFLETKQFRRIGGTKELEFHGRIISATNANLEENGFREDLYFRLSMLSITLPTLKERKQDIPILCDYFIAKANRDLKTSLSSISNSALEMLREKEWKGNIRELRNSIYSACLNAQEDVLSIEDFKDIKKSVPSKDVEAQMNRLCTEYIEKNGIETVHVLEEAFKKEFLNVAYSFCPNITKLSLALGLSRNTLKKQLKEYGWHTEEE